MKWSKEILIGLAGAIATSAVLVALLRPDRPEGDRSGSHRTAAHEAMARSLAQAVPLTSVAPRARRVVVAPEEHPGPRAVEKAARKTRTLPPLRIVLPDDMLTPADRTECTETLVRPGRPVPPDPRVPPVILVDPRRGR